MYQPAGPSFNDLAIAHISGCAREGPCGPCWACLLLGRGLAVHWPRLARGSLHAASLSLFSAGSRGSIS